MSAEPRDTPGETEDVKNIDDIDDIEVRDPVSAPDADGVPRRTTRRFPLFTRDTARPEGGGRAAPGDAPAPARQWPIIAVLGLVALGLLLTTFDQFRIGTILIGVALLGGAVLRWLLPGVGMLAVRSRFTDIATYGVLGAAIVLLALMAQPNPWLQIPFLKDTLHFTVDS
ncbi:Membrane protein OS=Streptomyces aurantiogriseus OX=66870 GN=GCM10010251_15010 PE=4 SV=1 [Streptomyces aurantiogriseus]|uniref:Membrane protein n=1 Tax=Streptomyces aurantiogriseus TaxID=66870 RepID=A0A918BZU5_9ACTN|nr:membrane protein [Streptomyces aurantiogriseus]